MGSNPLPFAPPGASLCRRAPSRRRRALVSLTPSLLSLSFLPQAAVEEEEAAEDSSNPEIVVRRGAWKSSSERSAFPLSLFNLLSLFRRTRHARCVPVRAWPRGGPQSTAPLIHCPALATAPRRSRRQKERPHTLAGPFCSTLSPQRPPLRALTPASSPSLPSP